MAVVQPYTPHSDDWFETQEAGVVHYTPSRTITDADVLLFGGMTGDLCELHTNEAYARTTEFGGRIAHGMLNLSLAHGLVTRAGHLVGTGIALLGWNNISFHGPVRIGETVQARWTTIEKRQSRSRPDAGIVIDRVELLNQDGRTVVSGDVATLVRKRPA
ncbi:MaoC/PaaZ C-terminal domain-containing protein [Mesorhizobium sp. L-8-3]|uniref:MaoC/PaaZ C-terminal domain-containing protein n=1 Tax=Mesorhizobium sp. L-8-3 TaxID=2744522 RepID=UPI0019275102|nr:MaoC/PaaZ C-terminal domain-containing protein [Mesorhizobium sp. L-8-3]BCH23483.1 MaoC family dehydratase [Mesorhizobium sp. L-8-3]